MQMRLDVFKPLFSHFIAHCNLHRPSRQKSYLYLVTSLWVLPPVKTTVSPSGIAHEDFPTFPTSAKVVPPWRKKYLRFKIFSQVLPGTISAFCSVPVLCPPNRTIVSGWDGGVQAICSALGSLRYIHTCDFHYLMATLESTEGTIWCRRQPMRCICLGTHRQEELLHILQVSPET